jgi:serine phosphatase RsbU (regulator of sigma subunit)
VLGIAGTLIDRPYPVPPTGTGGVWCAMAAHEEVERRVPTPLHERFLALLSGQKDALELVARGAALADVLDLLARLIEAQSVSGAKASVLLVDDDGRHLLHGAAPGLPDDYNEAVHGVAIGPAAGSCGTAAYRREPVIVTDIATDPLWEDHRHLAQAAGLAACWSVPILAGDGAVLGTFAMYHEAPRAPDGQDLALLASFVQLAALAIERDRDLRTMERQKQTAEALLRVGGAIAARTRLADIVQLATDEATALTHAAFGAFFYNVVTGDGGSYMLYTLSGAPREAFERFPMPRNTAIFAPTFNGEGVVRLHDVLADPRYGRNAPHAGMPAGHLPVRSYLAAPVVTADGQVAGGLFFGHPEPGVFDAAAEALAVGIAAQAAVAIEHARLLQDAEREIAARKRAFEERDRVARVLQQSLLPSALPRIDGVEVAARYRACSDGIGGDFYDVFALGDDRWGIVVGDVCGKGAEAASMTALARHTLRTAAMLDPRPSAVLRVLHEALLEHDDRGTRFCTAVYGVLERNDAGAALTVACGGHPPPLVARAGGVSAVPVRGHLLGAFADVILTDATVALGPGDAVVLHTDGLTDVGAGSDALGPDWVAAAVAVHHAGGAQAIAGALAHGAARLQAVTGGRDDVAVLALRLRPESPAS